MKINKKILIPIKIFITIISMFVLSGCPGPLAGDSKEDALNQGKMIDAHAHYNLKAVAGSNVIPLPSPGFIVEQTRSDPDRPARVHDKSYNGPIIDTHAHLYPPTERDANIADINIGQLKNILKLLKKTGVKLIIFMPTPNDGIRRNQELGVVKREMIRNMNREKIRLFCGSNYITNWLDFAYRNSYTQEKMQHVLKRLTTDIDSGTYSGVGEIGNYHFDKGFRRQHVIEFPTSFEPFLNIIDLITEKGMWLDLHAEPVGPKGKSYEKEVFGGIELLFRRNPRLKLIYSHTAMTNPINVRRILKKYPNVVMNVKIETRHNKWKNLEPVVNTKGELYDDWGRIFEQMPERFMIGTDFHFGREGVQISKYKKKIKLVRRILGTINPEAVKLIAYENAEKLFKEIN